MSMRETTLTSMLRSEKSREVELKPELRKMCDDIVDFLEYRELVLQLKVNLAHGTMMCGHSADVKRSNAHRFPLQVITRMRETDRRTSPGRLFSYRPGNPVCPRSKNQGNPIHIRIAVCKRRKLIKPV